MALEAISFLTQVDNPLFNKWLIRVSQSVLILQSRAAAAATASGRIIPARSMATTCGNVQTFVAVLQLNMKRGSSPGALPVLT